MKEKHREDIDPPPSKPHPPQKSGIEKKALPSRENRIAMEENPPEIKKGLFHYLFLGKRVPSQLYSHIPLWGIISFCMVSLLFAYNINTSRFGNGIISHIPNIVSAYIINSYIIGILFPLLFLLSLVIKYRLEFSLWLDVGFSAGVFLLVLFFVGDKVPVSGNLRGEAGVIVFYFAVMLLLLMLVRVYKKKTRQEIYSAYAFSLILSFIAQFYSTSQIDPVSIILFILYGISSVLFFMEMILMFYQVHKSPLPFSPLRAFPLLFFVPLTLGISLYAGFSLKASIPSLLQQLAEQMTNLPSSTFSTSTDLGRIQGLYQSKKIVLRILGDCNAYRITGITYNKYIKGNWRTDSVITKIPHFPPGAVKELSIKSANQLEEEGKLYSMFDNNKEYINKEFRIEKYMISLARNDIIFFPENAYFINIKNNIPQKSPLTNFTGTRIPVNEYQLLLADTGTSPLAEENLPDKRDTQVPPEILPYMKKLAEEITQNAHSDYRKITDIQSYLQNNYTYKPGFSPDQKGMDPVQEFLFYKKSAHCEYFASSMVLLLRSLGIPARYKVGFIAHEYNPQGSFSVVREMDAHAWVSVYIPHKGWCDFDPTPPQGVPGYSDKSSHPDWGEYIRMKIGMLWSYVKNGDFKRFLGESLVLIKKTPVIPITVFIILLLWLLRKKIWEFLTRYKKVPSIPPVIHKEDEKILSLQGLLKQMDIILSDMGFHRPPHLTLIEYSQYLNKQIADQRKERETPTAEEKEEHDPYPQEKTTDGRQEKREPLGEGKKGKGTSSLTILEAVSLEAINSFCSTYSRLRYREENIGEEDLQKMKTYIEKIPPKSSHT